MKSGAKDCFRRNWNESEIERKKAENMSLKQQRPKQNKTNAST